MKFNWKDYERIGILRHVVQEGDKAAVVYCAEMWSTPGRAADLDWWYSLTVDGHQVSGGGSCFRGRTKEKAEAALTARLEAK